MAEPSQAPAPASTRSEVRRLLELLRPHRWRVWLATLTLLLASGIGLSYPQVLRYAVNVVFESGEADRAAAGPRLDLFAAGVLGLICVHAALVWVRHYMWSWLAERAVTDLRKLVQARLLSLPPAWFHERRSGEIVGRLSGDVTVVQTVVGSDLSMALRNGVTLIGGVVLLAIQSPTLTLAMVVLVPPLVVFVVWFGRMIRRMSTAVQDRLAEAAARLEESVSAIDTVQSFVREEHERRGYDGAVERAFEAARALVRWRSTFMATTVVVSSASVVGIFWLGGRAVLEGRMTTGDLAAFLFYTALVAGSVGTIASLWGSLQRAAGATERIFEIIDTEPSIADPPSPKALPEGGGRFSFETVDYAYPSRPDRHVLEEVRLEVAPGDVLALVGPSGAGKSTVAALLQRFDDPVAGRITFEGVDLRELRLAELRGAMAVVSQDPVLFSGSVRENIAYGRDDATPAEIEAAARDAHATEFIEAFSEGWDTLVGERGVKLSGGQRQRIAIARAILRNPRVLILDEATSSLDAESEALVQEALTRLMQGRTTLVIAHRLSTVRDADRIVVLERGRIVEAGRHEVLMREDGIYKRLVEHQVIAEAS